MVKLKVFIIRQCPYCKQAIRYLDELMKDKKYNSIEIEYIDEIANRELATKHDYYYVPSFYYQDKKLFEGVVTFERVEEILDKVIEKKNA